MPCPGSFKLDNVTPFLSKSPTTLQRNISLKSWAGYFYCSVPKFGQVHVECNKEAFRDYPVQGTWVMSLLQAEKISLDTARDLVHRVASGVSRLLVDLDILERQTENARVLREQRAVQASISASLRPWRSIAPVDEWISSFDTLQERYQFLVLDGPSRMGKTAFARSNCPAGRQVLEINCAAGGEPDFRPYKYGTHGLIICDEIQAQAVAAQRKLFQAGTACVQMGTSPTNIHVYLVFVHRVRIICCSNKWMESLARLTEDDQEWITKNSIYVYCDQPLWEES